MSETRADFRESVRTHRDAGTCYLCGKPVDPSQGYHGATGAHWDCHQKVEDDFTDSMRRLGGMPRKPEGQGATALKAKAMAIAAIEKALGAEIYDVTLWNQKGVYRGPRWDLDSWGVYFKFDLGGSVMSGEASSLAIMTQCCGYKSLCAKPRDGTYSFDLHNGKDE